MPNNPFPLYDVYNSHGVKTEIHPLLNVEKPIIVQLNLKELSPVVMFTA